MAEAGHGGRTLHVLLRKEELDPARIAGKTLIVVDVLFATTSIITALDRGMAAVYPARDADEARSLADQVAAGAGRSGHAPVLSGETMFRFIDGFAPPTPLALAAHLEGRNTLIYTTTNGTVALRAGAGAARVLVGALINAAATAAAVEAEPPGTVVILCAGTAGAFNMEDFYGAGCLVDRLTGRGLDWQMTDAALAAHDYFRSLDAGTVLRSSMVGRLMHDWGLDREVEFAARVDDCDIAAALNGNRVELINRL